MRCGQSLQKRCMPGVGRSKIQPRRPRICEVLGRPVAPVVTQPDDKRAGGRVEGRNSAAFIGRDPKTPTKVGHLNLHVSKFAKIQMPTSSSMPAHRLNNSVIHLCHKLREKRSGCVTPKEDHARQTVANTNPKIDERLSMSWCHSLPHSRPPTFCLVAIFKVGLGISRTNADSQWNTYSLQRISSIFLLWKRNDSSVVLYT